MGARSTGGEGAAGWLERLARHGDGREALRFEGRTIHYAELARAAARAAKRLAELGIEGGDVVAVLAPPSVSGVVLIHALLARGVVMLPLNARLSEREHRDAIESTQARYLVVPEASAEGRDSQGGRLVAGSPCGLISLATGDDGVSVELSTQSGAMASDEAEMRERRSRRLAERAALVLLTSGTSGRPKGAVLSFDNLMASADGSARLLGSHADDRWLLCMPIFHIGGLSILTRSALVGACVVLHARFEAAEVARALEAERITRVSFVATMLERVLDVRGDRPPPESLALVLLGGGPASARLLERARALGYPIAPTYGLTEAASQVATRPPGVPAAEGDDLAAGLEVLPGVEVRIVDPTGRERAAGVEGEIEVRGPIVMSGYLEDPKATRDAIRGGWLATGDIGRLDDQGRLRVLDRRSDLILSGGENVYPAEIEAVLLEAEGVEDAAVFGVPDAEFGARPAAAVVLRDGATFDAEALAKFCGARLAPFKRPVEIEALEELPRTATGKVLRRTLRARWNRERRDRGC